MINVKPSTLGQMLISSVRYALGRDTYIVADTCSWVKRFWKHLDSKERLVIRRDLANFRPLSGPGRGEWYALEEWVNSR